MNRILAAVAVALALAMSVACAQPATDEQPATKTDRQTPSTSEQSPARREHVFRGRVEKVDATAKTLTVNGENVEGWMGPMTMVYTPDKPDVLDKVKAGDQITAKVYDGDFSTLHDVQVVPAVP